MLYLRLISVKECNNPPRTSLLSGATNYNYYLSL
nr:MAG TPA: hypothetical protein [Caudoviricetes sp.]